MTESADQSFDLFSPIDRIPDAAKTQLPVTHWALRFLNEYVRTCSVMEACRWVRITIDDYEDAMRHNEEFAVAFRQADKMLADNLERVAYDRAIKGWDDPVFYKGEECGSIRRFDNKLLLEMLKARKPELYVERSTNIHVDLRGASLLLPPPGVMHQLRPEVMLLAERIVRGQVEDTTNTEEP